MKQVEVHILGQSYILGCPEGGEERLQAAVHVVDREMSAIRDGGKVKTRERIALLAALKLAEQLPAATDTQGAEPTRARAVTADDGSGIDLDALVKRIDAALGNDGHLL